ncbi:hypothetical protein TrLO_g1849 [Triparma laevis f. longispina]|uniref:Uncharacterized protein n=1 Tax=Triparma laevis f. longispina TaxID=1714387 RepID=A0A9W7A7C6_9STRA|nr:hypothetical protein TrLO_g1849 [Triparma laevis f. longispina]
MEEQDWFEPMVVVLGKGIVKAAAWGLMARIIIGAVLSVTDLATDLVILHQFWNGGEDSLDFRNAQLASLAASIALQLLLVYIQNSKKGVRRILKEMAIVVTGLKSPVDAYRVASGAEQENDTEFYPMTEMTFSKYIEMLAESIPGIVIQTSAILNAMGSEEEGDIVFYVGMKVVRRDSSYWMPVYGVIGFLISLLIRVTVKVVVDFAGVVQLRHPFETGGCTSL